MYNRKSVGQRMESWGTPALTEYSCANFLSRTTQRTLLLRKTKYGEISNLIFHKFVMETSIPKFIENLRYISIKVQVASDLLKALVILSYTTVSRSAVDLQSIKKTWKHTGNQKKVIFLHVINKPIIYKFFKDFTDHRKKTNRVVAFCHN